jgi:hypothetical protein
MRNISNLICAYASQSLDISGSQLVIKRRRARRLAPRPGLYCVYLALRSFTDAFGHRDSYNCTASPREYLSVYVH